MSPLISKEENVELCAMLSGEDIWCAVKQLGSLKTPGLDGMFAIFYKHFWHVVGRDVINSVQSFFASGYLLQEVNHLSYCPNSYFSWPC